MSVNFLSFLVFYPYVDCCSKRNFFKKILWQDISVAFSTLSAKFCLSLSVRLILECLLAKCCTFCPAILGLSMSTVNSGCCWIRSVVMKHWHKPTWVIHWSARLSSQRLISSQRRWPRQRLIMRSLMQRSVLATYCIFIISNCWLYAENLFRPAMPNITVYTIYWLIVTVSL